MALKSLFVILLALCAISVKAIAPVDLDGSEDSDDVDIEKVEKEYAAKRAPVDRDDSEDSDDDDIEKVEKEYVAKREELLEELRSALTRGSSGQVGSTCTLLSRCAGNLHCYREKGFSAFKSGICVTCVRTGLKCQDDDMCCGGTQCNKNSLISVDGTCDFPARSGAVCYRKEQCYSGTCNKKLFHTKGNCA